ncbi:MAG: terminase small subunit [Clostridia bacterium]|nr:terminase small subunit [Clostridia bacterium]
MDNKLKPRERLFCFYFCQSRSPRLAAANAGYGVFAKRAAAKLICRTDIQSEIERLDSVMPVSEKEIVSGYRNLAFGSAADAFSLVLCDAETLGEMEIENLDLLNVSEIKKPKGGGIEIKFFDRLKALEKLQELSSSQGGGETPAFYDAIEKSAAALKEDFNAE